MHRKLPWLMALLGPACDPPDPNELGVLTQPVLDGTPTTAYEDVVAVRRGDAPCTGVLVAPDLVLTARQCAHPDADISTGCFRFSPPEVQEDLSVVFGPNADMPLHEIAVVEHITEPEESCHDDLVLLRLATAVPSELAAPRPTRSAAIVPGEPLTLVGYGRASGGVTGIKHKATGTVRCVGGPPDCSATAGYLWSMALFESEDTTGCDGDGGAPALDADGLVIGLTSFATTMVCQPGVIYTDVTRFSDFLGDFIQDDDFVPKPPPEVADQTLQLPPDGGGCSLARDGGAPPPTPAGLLGLAALAWAVRQRRGVAPSRWAAVGAACAHQRQAALRSALRALGPAAKTAGLEPSRHREDQRRETVCARTS